MGDPHGIVYDGGAVEALEARNDRGAVVGEALAPVACRVQGAGFRVQGSGFRVQGARFRAQVFGLSL